MRLFKALVVTGVLALGAAQAQAATCGSDGGGFEAWKVAFAPEAKAAGIGPRGLAALAGTHYATKTIYADRHQKSFHLGLDAFMRLRGAAGIASRGRALKAQNAGLFASLEARYGVPPGPIIAIWGMETGFGAVTGSQNTISAVASLAYDCRRHDYFTEQAIAALKLCRRTPLEPGCTAPASRAKRTSHNAPPGWSAASAARSSRPSRLTYCWWHAKSVERRCITVFDSPPLLALASREWDL